MPPHLLTNFETQKYYHNELRFSGVYSRNNLSIIKHRAYIINRDEYESIGTHCIALYMNAENVTYFEFLKKLENSLKIKNISTYIYRIQAWYSIICGLFCIEFIDFMLKSKSILKYTNSVCLNEYKKNDKIILKYFQLNLNKLK